MLYIVVWQKPTQHYITIFYQLKNTFKEKKDEVETTGGKGVTQWSQKLDHRSWEGVGLGAQSKGKPSTWRATPLPPSLEGRSERVEAKGIFMGKDRIVVLVSESYAPSMN